MNAAARDIPFGSTPLVVDMDGTLLRTDTFLECVAWTMRHAPWRLLLAPFWLLRGRAVLKRRLAEPCTFDALTLPLHEEFVGFLRVQKAAGRRLVLATGADWHLARRVADSLDGLFSDVIASDGARNLTGAAKARELESRFGAGGFDYAANERADLSVWSRCRRVISVSAPAPLRETLRRAGRVEAEFLPAASSVRPLLSALRPHQWLKNLLVAVPVVTSHRWHEAGVLLQVLVAFAGLCCVASSAYLVNDLLDLEHDRRHPEKRRRPLAAGTFPILGALALAPSLLVAGLALSEWLPPIFQLMLSGYFAATLVYSVWLKKVVLVDVFLLAGLYTLRVFLGGAATGIAISGWLLAFTLFYFLSLAYAKRYVDLTRGIAEKGFLPGRGYAAADREHIGQAGVAAGYVAVLVFALYLQSPDVRILYHRPDVLWFLCPVLLFWQSRLWLLASRGLLSSDPVLFAVRDPVSHAAGAAAAVLILLAR